MLTMLAALVPLMALTAVGYALLRIFAPHAALFWFERASFAFVLGSGAMALLWFWLSPVYAYAAMPLVLLIAGGLIVLGGRFVTVPRGQGDTGGHTALTLFIAVQFLLLIAASLRTPLGWDGIFNFEIKARAALWNATRGGVPPAYFADLSRAWTHPRYPWMVPFAELWTYSFIGAPNDMAVKWIFPCFFMALAGIVAGVVRRRSGALAAQTAVIAMGLIPALTLGPGAITGYADTPLAAAIAAAVSCAILAIDRDRSELFVLAGIFAGIAAWTKTEGLALSCVIAVVAAVSARTPRALLIGAIPLAVMMPWYLFQRRFAVPDLDFVPWTMQHAVAHVDRLALSASLFARDLVRPGRWGLLWPSFAAAVAIAAFQRSLTKTDVVIVVGAGLALAFYIFIFVFSAWTDVAEHIRASMERLMIPLAPLALAFTINQTWPSST